MKIKEIKKNKKQFLSLLLLADEQEDMIDQYLEHGTMYVLDDDGIQCECVVTDEGHGILEIKNIATKPEAQGKGYGRILIEFIVEKYIIATYTTTEHNEKSYCRFDSAYRLL